MNQNSYISYNQEEEIDYSESWGRVIDRLRAEYGESTFRSWLKPLNFEECNGGIIIMTVPSRFIREWVMNNYLETILSFWKDENPDITSIEVFLRSGGTSNNATETKKTEQTKTPTTSPKNTEVSDFTRKHVENNLGSQLDPRFRFDNFVTGESNELAFAAAKLIASSKEAVDGSNPLFIYGGVGLGKTHLLHAVAWEMRAKQPERNVVFLSAEKFMYQFIRSLRNRDILSFKENFRNIDVLLIDDIQFISGKESTMEEFFHTFNTLTNDGKQVIISCDRSPSDLSGMGERARSRLGWGLVVDVHDADYDLRRGILEDKMRRSGIRLSEDVIELLATKITSNIRELEGALNKLFAHAKLINSDITVNSAYKILKDLLRSNERRVTISEIQKEVSKYYQITLADLTSSRRSRNIARPRQISMYIAKIMTTRSLVEIGAKFGGKDHTTVMHAVKKVESLIKSDDDIAEDIEKIKAILSN